MRKQRGRSDRQGYESGGLKGFVSQNACIRAGSICGTCGGSAKHDVRNQKRSGLGGQQLGGLNIKECLPTPKDSSEKVRSQIIARSRMPFRRSRMTVRLPQEVVRPTADPAPLAIDRGLRVRCARCACLI